MPRKSSSSRCVLRTLLIPGFIGLCGLALLWPLFEASQRYRAGEEVLFGPIPSHEQQIASELQQLAGTDDEISLQAATHILGD